MTDTHTKPYSEQEFVGRYPNEDADIKKNTWPRLCSETVSNSCSTQPITGRDIVADGQGYSVHRKFTSYS